MAIDDVDLRVIRIGIEISGRINWYEGLRMKATGTKFANPLQNECTVTISGLSQPVRDRILTDTSPYNVTKTPKRLIVDAGRQSYGTFRLFIGDITSADPSSPPDVDVVIKAKTENSQAMSVASVSGASTMRVSAIAQQVATTLGVALQFQASDKNVANWSFTGPALKMVSRLAEMGGVRAFIDDDTLIVKDGGSVLRGAVRILNMDSGLVGIPKATEKGIDVTFLIDRETKLGGLLRLDSRMNKPLNGDYSIDQLKFDIATNEDPFFYQARCTRL